MIPTEKILVAAEKRHSIRTGQTNAVRLLDGSGDGFPGLTIDDFAGHWMVQTQDEREPKFDPNLGYLSLYWKPMLKTGRTDVKHLAGATLQEPFCVLESGLQFEIDFRAGYSPGLFLDQRTNRNQLRNLARDMTFLNTFSYTCAFGVAAAVGGASTVNLDLSRHYLDWGKRNYEINQNRLRASRFYLWRCFRLVGTFSAARQKI